MGNVDVYNSRRKNHNKCYYWLRDEDESIDANKWVLENKASGFFYGRSASAGTNQENQAVNIWSYDKDMITLETEERVEELTRGCIVLYDGKPWFVQSVQKSVIEKRTEYCKKLQYKYYVSLRC